MLALIHMELFKLVKRPMTWMLFALICVGTGIADAVLVHNLQTVAPAMRASALRDLTLPGTIPVTLQTLATFASIVLAILSASAIGNEYGWGTLRPMLATGMPRFRFLVAKFVALLGAALIVVLAPLALNALVAAPVALTHGVPILSGTADAAWWGALTVMIARTLLTLLVPMALAFLLALVGRSQAAGVGAALGWMVGEQVLSLLLGTLGASWARTLGNQLPGALGRELLQYNTFAAVSPHVAISEGRAVLSLALYTAICLALAVAVFRQRDIHGAA